MLCRFSFWVLWWDVETPKQCFLRSQMSSWKHQQFLKSKTDNTTKSSQGNVNHKQKFWKMMRGGLKEINWCQKSNLNFEATRTVPTFVSPQATETQARRLLGQMDRQITAKWKLFWFSIKLEVYKVKNKSAGSIQLAMGSTQDGLSKINLQLNLSTNLFLNMKLFSSKQNCQQSCTSIFATFSCQSINNESDCEGRYNMETHHSEYTWLIQKKIWRSVCVAIYGPNSELCERCKTFISNQLWLMTRQASFAFNTFGSSWEWKWRPKNNPSRRALCRSHKTACRVPWEASGPSGFLWIFPPSSRCLLM